MENKKPKKRIYVINRDFQFRFANVGMILAMMSSILSLAIILIPLYEFRIIQSAEFLPKPVIASMIALILVNTLAVRVFGIYISHSIAGPLFSMHRKMRLIELGRWNISFRIRATDEIHQTARNFNAMVAGLLTQAQADAQDLEKIHATVKSIQGKLSESEKSALLESLAALEARNKDRLTPEDIHDQQDKARALGANPIDTTSHSS